EIYLIYLLFVITNFDRMRTCGNETTTSHFIWRQLMKRITVAAWVLSAIAAIQAPSFAAENFPQKDIQFVIPWNAGGSNDIAARQLQKIVADQSGVNLIVENVPGAT